MGETKEMPTPPPGEAQVRKHVNEHLSWRVYATDYKQEPNGNTVIFYLESKSSKKFKDLDGDVRVVKPIFVETFTLQRVNREPANVARQLINTANTILSENMRAVGK